MLTERREDLLHILHRMVRNKKDQIKELEILINNTYDEDISDKDIEIALTKALQKFVAQQNELSTNSLER